MHSLFPNADPHGRTPKMLILQAFTHGFEVPFFLQICSARNVAFLFCDVFAFWHRFTVKYILNIKEKCNLNV